jgi:transcription termination factor Rho
VSVLQRKELEDSPLADIHAIASELGIEGYRGLRKEDLIAAIVNLQGGGDDEPVAEEPDTEVDDKPRRRRSRRKPKADKQEADQPKAEQVEAEGEEPEQSETSEEDADDEEHESVSGILDVQSNGSGFLRRGDAPDVYVSPAQIRRCELRAGDEIAGPVRPPRRNERYPSLIRVEQINGQGAEPLEQRTHFDDLTAVYVTERLTVTGPLDGVPFGKGSRVAVSGPTGAGATRLLRDAAAELAKQSGDLTVSVVLAGARPEEVTEWQRDVGLPITGGSFDQAPDEQAQAAQLAVERGKRVAERGGDAVVVIDSLEALDPKQARRLFGAGRKLEEGGSLTILAAVGENPAHLRLASTRIILQGGTPEPTLTDSSGTHRPDLLK